VPHHNQAMRKPRLWAGAILIEMLCAHGGARDGRSRVVQQASTVTDLAKDRRYSFVAFASGLPHPARLVIRDAKSWEDFWAQLTRSGAPGVPAPEVDFKHDEVLIAALGPLKAGHDIHITGVHARGDTLYADVIARSGIAPACRTDEINSPLAIVIVSRSGGPVKFLEAQKDLRCREGSDKP
jgi:hypothetical protein